MHVFVAICNVSLKCLDAESYTRFKRFEFVLILRGTFSMFVLDCITEICIYKLKYVIGFVSKRNYSETCLNRYPFGPKKNIGLDRLSDYTGLYLLHWAKLFIKNWNTYTPKSFSYMNNYIVYCWLDIYSISYQIGLFPFRLSCKFQVT